MTVLIDFVVIKEKLIIVAFILIYHRSTYLCIIQKYSLNFIRMDHAVFDTFPNFDSDCNKKLVTSFFIASKLKTVERRRLRGGAAARGRCGAVAARGGGTGATASDAGAVVRALYSHQSRATCARAASTLLYYSRHYCETTCYHQVTNIPTCGLQ